MKKITIKNKEYALKIVETEQDLRNNPLTIDLLNRLATEAEIDLAKKLWGEGIALEKLHAPEELWQINEKWISEAFSGKAGRMLFILEDNNKPVHATIITVNDPEARKKNKVDGSVGTYIYVTHAVTEEAFKGKGLFSGIMDKITTMMLNPKRDVKHPIHYSISVSNAPAVRLSDNEELNYIMNLPAYTGMWQKRFEDNKLQVRFQDLKTGAQEGRERLPLDKFLNEKQLDESLVDKLIKEKKPEAKGEGKFVRGLFAEGQDNRSHAEAVSARKGAPRSRL
jgi:hypothetical protein